MENTVTGKLSEALDTVRRAWGPALVLVAAGFASYLLPSSRNDSLIEAVSIYIVYLSLNAFVSVGYYGCLLVAMTGKNASVLELWSIGKPLWRRAVAGELMYYSFILLPLWAGLFVSASMFSAFEGDPGARAMVAVGALAGLAALAWIPVRLSLWKVSLLIGDVSAWRSFKESRRITKGHFWYIFLAVILPYAAGAGLTAFDAGGVPHSAGVMLTSVILPVFMPVIVINVYRRIAAPAAPLLPYVWAQDAPAAQ